ncbi:rhodanese-like domain-containing protein [Flavobacteriaceae bacterium AU392]|nr:rhodanese-like domain-containing protein [Flavobacteriaceae bacterium]RKM84117.1 rhodanese-like domain-containing protein [Flavobacteriaceae bacterium AU392]
MKHFVLYIFILYSTLSIAQESISEVLVKYNNESIPYIHAQKLHHTNVILLDAREIEEYNVSHIKDAIYVGYKDFKIKDVEKEIKNKNEKVVVYCSLGVRSEDIAEKLKKAGYTNVYNLFGGIFEWKNNDYDVYNSSNKITENVHAFSEEWSKWLTKGQKVYE